MLCVKKSRGSRPEEDLEILESLPNRDGSAKVDGKSWIYVSDSQNVCHEKYINKLKALVDQNTPPH